MTSDVQRIARRDKKAFFNDQSKEIEENNRMGETKDCFKKVKDTKGTLFFWAPKSLQMVTVAMKLKDAYSVEEKL